MMLRDFKLMVDENISPEVTAMLRKEGLDVFSVEESEFVGSTDRQSGHVPPIHTIAGLRRLFYEDLTLNTPFILICQMFPGFRVRVR